MKPGEVPRSRMIVDLPSDVQMAIRLRAVKSGITTGEVVRRAVELAFAADIEEAKAVAAAQKEGTPPCQVT